MWLCGNFAAQMWKKMVMLLAVTCEPFKDPPCPDFGGLSICLVRHFQRAGQRKSSTTLCGLMTIGSGTPMRKLVACLAAATTVIAGTVSPLGGAWAVGIINVSFEAGRAISSDPLKTVDGTDSRSALLPLILPGYHHGATRTSMF